MKMVTLRWPFMTSTLRFPVVKAGRIISLTAYEKYEGQWGGRFPEAYAVVTDDFVAEQAYCRRGDAAEDQPGSLRHASKLRPSLFRTPQFAEKAALRRAAGGRR